MGFSMAYKGLNGRFIKELKIWHEETESFKYFIKKGYNRGRLSYKVANKWNLSKQFVNLDFVNWKNYLKSIKHWPGEYKKYFSIIEKGNLLSFFLIKLYERFFLKGYVKQSMAEITANS